MESFEFAINNNLQVDKKRIPFATIREPVRGDKIEVSGKFTLDHDTFGRYDDFINSTTRKLVLTFTGANVPNSSTAQKIQFTFNNVKLESFEANADDPGQFTEDIGFRAYRDATNNEVVGVVVNAETTIAN